MSERMLREKILPPLPAEGAHEHHLVMCMDAESGDLLAHVFATSYYHANLTILWITQLCVISTHRNQGIATNMLACLRERLEGVERVGVLSSHPFAVCAVLSVFGPRLPFFSRKHMDLMSQEAGDVMAACSVPYVRDAVLKGGLFSSQMSWKVEEEEDGNERDGGRAEVGEEVVCCADTGFWVDHGEPEKALRVIEDQGVRWPLGRLLGGCEFAVVVAVR